MSHSPSHGHAPHSHGHSHSHAPRSPPPPPPYTSSEPNEAQHQATVVATFDSYRQAALSGNQRRRADYYALPKQHRDLLMGYKDLLSEVDEKLQVNAELIRRMIEVNPFPPPEDAALDAAAPTEADHERLRSTLRQCVRDWSEAGKRERDTAYTPILDALRQHFAGLPPSERAQKKVLVPGAGLGRLAWEIVRAGFTCQANEFSLHMLIASAFILNSTSHINEFPLYPYLHSFSNTRSKADLLTPCYIPDVAPDEIAGGEADFSFAAGDFLELYDNAPGSWDVCVTCFFIDTARDIVHYLRTIHGLLKPGGLWINCGPTLWHFENDRDASSIELTLEDVKALAQRVGFELSDEREIETCYTTNPRSLLRHEYTAAFWTARKVGPAETEETTQSPPSPRRLLKSLNSSTSSPRTAREWSPGHPIRFGTVNVTATGPAHASGEFQDGMDAKTTGKEWTPGDAIRFAEDGPADGDPHGAVRFTNQQNAKQGTRTKKTLFRPSGNSTTATRGSKCPTPSPLSSTQSWPLNHRWDPPSPSPSPSRSTTSTARFSLSRTSSMASAATPGRAPPLSQKELDELVAGVDFGDDEDFELELTQEIKPLVSISTATAPGRTRLAPQELDALLEGIDFSADVALSDDEPSASFDSDIVFCTAPTSVRPTSPTPATPARLSPSHRVIVRGSPSAAPSLPKEPDVFSLPRTTTDSPLQPTHIFSPARHPKSATTSPFPSVLQPIPRLPASPSQARPYTTGATEKGKDVKGKGKAGVVIDLCEDSPFSSPRPAKTKPFDLNLTDQSDDSIVFIEKKDGRPREQGSKGAMAHAAVGKGNAGVGWFQRTAGMASKVAPSTSIPSSSFHTPSSHPASTLAAQAGPRSPSSKPPTATTSSATASVSRPTESSSRWSRKRPGSKAAEAEEKQAELKRKWPKVFSYGGWGKEVEVICTTDEREIERVLKRLEGPLGFDLEWNPYTRVKGGATTQGKTALVQICDEKTILLVQVARMRRFPPVLKEFIEDPTKIKLGVQIAGDANKLTRDFSHRPAGTLELNALVRRYDPERFVGRVKPGLIGLQELTGIYLDQYLPKEASVRCGRWNAELSEEQIAYGANDVYASLQIFLRIQGLTGGIPPEDLISLSTTPYDNFRGFDSAPLRMPAPSTERGAAYKLAPLPSAPAAPPVGSRPATAAPTPSAVLPPRKFEAFHLFHHEGLSITEISTRMSQSGSIKVTSVLWSLMAVVDILAAKGVAVEWDVPRLIQAAEEVPWSDRMKEEHQKTLDGLRAAVSAK
ncbi:hypothetical protein JCM11641_000935 [Rhodosporidiobolus odoratus]